MHAAITSRLKIMAALDIAERRLPQDGRIQATVLGRPLDLRISTVPTPHGEKTVMRLLDNPDLALSIGEAGHQHFLQHFALEPIVDGLERIYQETIDSLQPSHP